MDHPVVRWGRAFVLLTLLATVSASSGCTSALATAVWLVKGPNIDAEFDGLREKRVAVVCRPMVGLTYRNSGVAKQIARQMNRLLAQNVRKIEVIDQRKVDEWIDEHNWDEYTEIGEALQADMVVGVDLERFSIYPGQTVYQGRANVVLKVYDCQSGELVSERRLPAVVYPPNSPSSAETQQEADFRREYVAILADQIARHFYPHDPHADFALDAKTIP